MKTLTLACALLPILWTSIPHKAQPLQSAETPAQVEQSQQAILITGASSGIGRKTAELFASKGFFVYAGARKNKDLEELSAIENVQGIRLDVTKSAEIEAAVETVRASGRGLYGLINNAGVVVIGPMIEMSEEDLQFQMDVNLYGPWRVTKAFAPLLIESRGRVSTTGSISGFVTWGLGGAYTMSKHAVEAYTDTLAVELEPFGVQVSVVEPGNFKSKISANMKKRLEESGYSTEGSRYKDRMDQILGGPEDREQHKEPDAVAEAFLRAFTDDEPKRRYLVVPNQREAEVTLRASFQRIAELNRDHEFAYDREALLEMLDEALKQTGQ